MKQLSVTAQNTNIEPSDLRKRAEERLRKTRADIKLMDVNDVQELVYELQMHQIELQVQNEELRDVSRELENTRDKYWDLYDLAPIGYLTLNSAGEILDSNLMAGTLLGANRKELANKKFSVYLASPSQDVFYLHSRKVLSTLESEICEIELKRPINGLQHLQLHSLANRNNGTWRVALHDITAIKKLEAKLILAKDTAQAANTAKSQFLANMSHEIRTPLNAIVGLSHLLQTQELTAKQQEFLSTLQLSADSLLNLINELLDIAKIETNSMEMESIPFDLSKIIRNAGHIMSVGAKEKNLALSVDTHHVDHPYYLGDPYRLRQVLLNLVGNAIKFTDQGGVKMAARTVRRVGDCADIEITITDTGIGIAPEKHDSVFGLFTQADASTTRRYGGTGLGLTICKQLIECMDGTIEIESAPGRGTAFIIQLPLPMTDKVPEDNAYLTSINKPSEPKIDKPQSNSQTKALILLVDDYAPNVLIASTFLENFGYDCDVAANGKDAIQKACNNNYSAILMDIQMHDMDGYEAMRAIRLHESRTQKSPTPIIAMTAHAMAGDREKCIAAGMNDYISKPFAPDTFRETVAKCVNSAF